MMLARLWRRYALGRWTLPLLLAAYLPSFVFLPLVAFETYRQLSPQKPMFLLAVFALFSHSVPGLCAAAWIARSALATRLPWVLHATAAVATFVWLPHYVASFVLGFMNTIGREGLVP